LRGSGRGAEATASWGVIRHQKGHEVRRLDSTKEMPAPDRRHGDDDQRYSTNTHARATQGAPAQRFTTEP